VQLVESTAMPVAMVDGARMYTLTTWPFTPHGTGTGNAGSPCRRRWILDEYLDFHESPVLPCDRSRRACYLRLCGYSSDPIRNRDCASIRRANVLLDALPMPVPAHKGELHGLTQALLSRLIPRPRAIVAIEFAGIASYTPIHFSILYSR
jgi:hypothetical protein